MKRPALKGRGFIFIACKPQDSKDYFAHYCVSRTQPMFYTIIIYWVDEWMILFSVMIFLSIINEILSQ